MTEKSSPGPRQTDGKNLVWRNRKKISQIINAYLYLPKHRSSSYLFYGGRESTLRGWGRVVSWNGRRQVNLFFSLPDNINNRAVFPPFGLDPMAAATFPQRYGVTRWMLFWRSIHFDEYFLCMRWEFQGLLKCLPTSSKFPSLCRPRIGCRENPQILTCHRRLPAWFYRIAGGIL